MVAALGLALPLCVRHITDGVLRAGAVEIMPRIYNTGAVMLGIIAAMTGFGIFNDYKGHDMGAKIERDLRGDLFAHYQKLPFSFFDDNQTGELTSRLTNDLLNISEVYHHVPEMILTNGIQIIGAFSILFAINWRLALVVFAVLPLTAVYGVIFYRKMQKAYKQNNERIAAINASAQESLSGIRTVKAYAGEAVETDKFNGANGRYYASRSGVYKSEALFYSVVQYFITPLITVAVAVAGGIWVSGGSLDIADLLAFIMYVAYLVGPVPGIASLLPFYQQGFTGYKRFREIMDTAPDIRDAEDAVELVISGAGARVEFDCVDFKYGGKDREYVLRGVSLCVKPGETVAIVGRSGIGKTTLCSLIPRFYDVSGGAVSIDGADVRSLTQDSLRRHIGVVRQDAFLFSGTVMENILFGRPGATGDEAVEAAKKANAHGFISELPKGYETEIGQRGVKLSGGQQQRISIAQVFLKNPPVLILDEATSALDYASEKAVMDSLKDLASGRTAFIIAHRLSTVRNADRVIVLGDDGIAEEGTHDELYALNGAYSSLYDSREAYM